MSSLDPTDLTSPSSRGQSTAWSMPVEMVSPPPPPVDSALPNVPGYHIARVLGRGGMGVVFQARQSNPDRDVALKMVPAAGRHDPELRDRFQREIEALARIQHPNIVQIYDVGSHDGCPYFSMELVRGGSLDRVLAGTPLSADDAAGLIETLARAVAAAHRAGVLHRDLKPANVLLQESTSAAATVPGSGSPTTTPQTLFPKIADFGLARGLDRESAPLTQTGVVLGTPSYMAPEQADGPQSGIGPATDIYALGAILYEVLTGRPPFRGESPWETVQQVLTQDPVPPRRLRPRVPYDLETIALKCLHKSPAQRYGSADELADDLRRFREGRPIAARRTPHWERAWKWSRRHPTAAALVVLLPTIVVLWGVSRWQRNAERARADAAHIAELTRERDRTQTQRDRAEANLRRALAMGPRLAQTLADDPGLRERPFQPLRERLLQSALAEVERLLDENRDHPDVQLELLSTLFRSGNLANETWRLAESATFLERAARIAEPRAKEGSIEWRLTLARIYSNLGHAQNRRGNAAAADAAFQQALQQLQAAQEAGATDELPRMFGNTFHDLGRSSDELGQSESSREWYEKAIARRRELADARPEDPELRADLAASLDSLGTLYRRQLKYAPAEQRYLAALELRRELARDQSVPRLEELARTLGNLTIVCTGSSRTAESRGYHAEAMAIFQRLYERDPANLTYRYNLACAYQHLGGLAANLDQDDRAARRAYDKSAELLDGLIQANGDVADWRVTRATIDFLRSMQDARVRNWIGSHQYATAAVQQLEAVLQKEPRHAEARERLVIALWYRADAADHQRESARAVRDLTRALAIDREVRVANGGLRRGLERSLVRILVRWTLAVR